MRHHLLLLVVIMPFLILPLPAKAGSPGKLQMRVGKANISVHFEPEKFHIAPDQIRAWILRAAQAVSDYYGRLPVKQLRIRLVARPGKRVITGTTWGYPDAHIRVILGTFVTKQALAADWIMTHEMVHLAFPDVAHRHVWLEEGIATYVEPVARARLGQIPVSSVWQQLVDGLPKGLPRAGDRGLDNTHTWGRTYWGGALFCLLAEVNIRRETHNRLGLRDALRAIVSAGGNIEKDWTLAHTLKIGDKIVGAPVLEQLYQQMALKPMSPDLRHLWQQLGVRDDHGRLVFANSAPWASIRASITAPPSPRSRAL